MSWRRVSLGPIEVPYPVALTLGAAAYFVAAKLGLMLASLLAAASPVWPASGLAVGMIFVMGRRLWPAIALGAFLANLTVGDPWLALQIAVGNTLEGVVGGYVLTAVLRRQSDAFVFARSVAYVAAAGLPTMINATTGVAVLVAAESVPPSSAIDVWVTWWIGDAIGVLVVAPQLALLRSQAKEPVKSRGRAASRLIVLAVAAAAVVAATLWAPVAAPAVFLCFPLILLTRHWFGGAGAVLGVLLTTIVLVGEVLMGHGPFVNASLNDNLLMLQVLLATIAVSALVFTDLHNMPLRLSGPVFVAACACAAAVFTLETRRIDRIDELHFTQIVAEANAKVRERTEIYLNLLHSGRALFDSSEEVTREEWRTFIQSLNFAEAYPGIKGMGVVFPVAPADLAAFLSRARADGAEDFVLKRIPGVAEPRAPHDDHLVITYIEPVETNLAALGLDIASEQARYDGALAARDSGEPAASGRITLVQDSSSHAGYLLYLALYDVPDALGTVDDRRGHFRGLVYVPLVLEHLLADALRPLEGQIAYRVYDGAASMDPVILDTVGAASGARISMQAGTIRLADRNLAVVWQSGPGFALESRWQGLLMSVALVLVGMLLAALIVNLQSLSARANVVAAEMTRALAASNARMRDAIEVMGSGFAMFDAGDRLLVHNEAFVDDGTRRTTPDLTGRSYEEIMRVFAYGEVTAVDALPDRAKWLRWRLDMHRNPPAEPLEIEWTDGRWMRVVERRTADGGTVGTWTDVTGIKLAEARLRAAVDAMEDGFGLFDADDRIVLHNAAFMDEGSRKTFGDDVTGRKFEEIVRAFAYNEMPAEAGLDRESWIAQRMERHRNPPEHPIEVEWGGGRWMRISERRTTDGSCVGISTDVTSLKTAQAQLRDAIESTSEGFLLADAQNRCVTVNQNFLDMYPISGRLAVPGAKCEDILRGAVENGEFPGIETREQIESYVAHWTAFFASRQPHVGERQLPDGRWVLVSHRPTSNGGYVTTFTDITEQRSRELELLSARDDLERRSAELAELAEELAHARDIASAANRGKSQFLANMSHELRTPLNAINGFSEILVNGLFGPIQPPKYQEYAELINKSGQHLLSLINDVLDLSKIEAGKMELHVEALPTEQLAYASVAGVQTMARDRGVELRTEVADDCSILHADARAVKQVILNLLSNAVKFTPSSGTVMLAISRKDNGVEVAVSDTGIGMTQEETERALELYGQVQSDLGKKQTGTGLGLPLVKSLVELHGGVFRLDSEKGRGTRASAVFPWKQDLPMSLA